MTACRTYLSKLTEDSNDGLGVGTITFTGGNYAIGSNGRGTALVNWSNGGATSLVVYLINDSQAVFIQNNADPLIGVAQQQTP
jgi:hypothetical protein